MSLRNNKKVKAGVVGLSLQINYRTIYESKFEIKIEDGDEEKLGELKVIVFLDCLMMNFPGADCLYKIAPNFDRLEIQNSKLSRISAWDLEGFDKIVELNLSRNDIEELPGNLFVHTPNLQNISFAENKIKVIGENILDPLRNLKTFNLRNNPGINVWYHHTQGGKWRYSTLAVFKEAILRCKPAQDVWEIVDEQKKEINELKKVCVGQNAKIDEQKKEIDGIKKVCDGQTARIETLEKKLEDVKQAGTFHKFDFSIKVNEKEFKVQKEILIANSPLLANLIRDNEGTDTLELKDISEEILNFMVNKSQPKPTANFIELYAASGRLQMKELMDLCGNILIGKVTPENALEVLSLSLKYPNVELQKKAHADYGKILEKSN